MFIGFDRNSHLFYEGWASLFASKAILPAPVITQATFVSPGQGPLEKVADGGSPSEFQFLFREDAFDPVTKLRRGRFYQLDRGASNPTGCKVLPPFGAQLVGKGEIDTLGLIQKDLTQFSAVRLTVMFPNLRQEPPTVVLGWRSAPTIWSVSLVESISTGEQMVTLRARETYGALPKLLLPEDLLPVDRAAILEKYDALFTDIFRSSPKSIVDLCRDLSECALRAKVRTIDPNFKGGEMSELIAELKQHLENNRVVEHYAEIVRRFHQRRKTALNDKFEIRPLMEKDAELSILCVSALLCDLGWAEWL